MHADEVRDFFESVDAQPSTKFSEALLARLRAEYLRADLDASRETRPLTLEPILLDVLHDEPRVGHGRRPERPNRPWSRRRIAVGAAAAAVIVAAIVVVRNANDDGVEVVPADPGPVSTTLEASPPPSLPADALNELTPGASVSSVTAGGPGLVAVGTETTDGGEIDGVVWTSTDGTTWARVPDEEGVFGGPGPQAIADVTVGGPGLVAVGRSSNAVGSDTYATAAVWTSADGFTWSRVPHDDAVFGRATGQPDEIFGMSAVTTGGPGLVAVGGRGGASDFVGGSGGWIADRPVGAVWTSIDGFTWSRVAHDPAVFGHWPTTSPQSEPAGWGLSASMSDIAPGGPGLVVVGDIYRGAGDGAGAVWTSADGIDWTLTEDRIEAVNISGLAVGGPGLVAVGTAIEEPPLASAPFDVAATVMAAVWSSVDGTTWSRVPPQPEVLGGPGYQAMDHVFPGGPGLVAIGLADPDGATVWTSADGTRWVRHDSTLGAGSSLDSLLRLYGFALA
jgi:hypothetical protein